MFKGRGGVVWLIAVTICCLHCDANLSFVRRILGFSVLKARSWSIKGDVGIIPLWRSGVIWSSRREVPGLKLYISGCRRL